MAKKRKKVKDEEGYEFKTPEFDEEEYLRKEVRDAKALFVTFVYAALIGIASFGLNFVDVALAALLGFIAIVFLRHIYPLIGIDTTKLEKKQWAGNIIMYLFTWLAVWILLTNPPFSDFASPTIENVDIYFGGSGNWTKLDDISKFNLTFGMNVSINATIVDNVEVDSDMIRITIKRGEEELTPPDGVHMTSIGKNRYAYMLTYVSQGRHEYTIKAKDINDHEVSFSGTFVVN